MVRRVPLIAARRTGRQELISVDIISCGGPLTVVHDGLVALHLRPVSRHVLRVSFGGLLRGPSERHDFH